MRKYFKALQSKNDVSFVFELLTTQIAKWLFASSIISWVWNFTVRKLRNQTQSYWRYRKFSQNLLGFAPEFQNQNEWEEAKDQRAMEGAFAKASAITDQRQKIEQYKHILSTVFSSNDVVPAKKFIDHSNYWIVYLNFSSTLL